MLVKGKSNSEEDDDPWRNISAADLAAALDRALIEDHLEAPPSGRMFVPIREVSLRSALLAAAPGDEDTQAVADSALEGMVEIEETLSRFTATPPERVVYCGCQATTMLGGCWGLFEFQLGARGYLYYQPDWGVGDSNECLPIFGAWEPAGSPPASYLTKTCATASKPPCANARPSSPSPTTSPRPSSRNRSSLSPTNASTSSAPSATPPVNV